MGAINSSYLNKVALKMTNCLKLSSSLQTIGDKGICSNINMQFDMNFEKAKTKL